MKIKFFDKKHKTISDGATAGLVAVGFVAASIITIGSLAYWGESTYPNERVVESISYVQNGQNYNIKDIYILYNDSEIRKCIRKGYVAREKMIGVDVDYDFIDIETGEKIASTKIDADKNDENNIEVSLNGYNYRNLSDFIYRDLYAKKESNEEVVTQEYLDDVIENKRFLGR